MKKPREDKGVVKQSTLMILLISLTIFWIMVLGATFLGIKLAFIMLGCVILSVILALVTIAVIANVMEWKI